MSELEQRLAEGIAAAKIGERERACELLLQVVDADQNIEAAWLWLSRVVDDPRDELIALENVLTINPHNREAQRELEQLKREHPDLAGEHGALPEPPEAGVPDWLRAAPAPPAPARRAEPPAAPAAGLQPGRQAGAGATASAAAATPAARPARAPEPAHTGKTPPYGSPAVKPAAAAIEAVDDSLRCPYCGKFTRETDTKCAACGKSIMLQTRQFEERSNNLNLLVIFSVILAVRGLLDVGAPFLALMLIGKDPVGPSFGSVPLPGAWGNRPDVNQAWLTIGLIVARSVLYLIFASGLWARIGLFYYGLLIFLGLNTAQSLFVTGMLAIAGSSVGNAGTMGGLAIGLVGVVISIVALYFAMGSWGDFQYKYARILCKLDSDARDAPTQARRGQLYSKHGMWGLAATHYAAAMQNQPSSLEYAKNYAIALSQTGREVEALGLLKARLEQNPADLQLPQMIELLEKKLAKKTKE
jgi:tetratricopeptide (TPR) repeat protein